VRILIPLSIATRNRVAYELTMAGTIVATVNFVYYIVSHVLDQLYNYVKLMFGMPPITDKFIDYCRGVIVLMLVVSCCILRRRAKQELGDIRQSISRNNQNTCCFCCPGRRKQ
jgi:hypothetical protein